MIRTSFSIPISRGHVRNLVIANLRCKIERSRQPVFYLKEIPLGSLLTALSVMESLLEELFCLSTHSFSFLPTAKKGITCSFPSNAPDDCVWRVVVIGAREPEGKEKKNEAGNFVIAWIAARTDSTSKCHTRAHSAVREGGSEVCSSAASKKGKCPQSTTYMKKNEKKKLAAFVFPRLTPVLYC